MSSVITHMALIFVSPAEKCPLCFKLCMDINKQIWKLFFSQTHPNKFYDAITHKTCPPTYLYPSYDKIQKTESSLNSQDIPTLIKHTTKYFHLLCQKTSYFVSMKPQRLLSICFPIIIKQNKNKKKHFFKSHIRYCHFVFKSLQLFLILIQEKELNNIYFFLYWPIYLSRNRCIKIVKSCSLCFKCTGLAA